MLKEDSKTLPSNYKPIVPIYGIKLLTFVCFKYRENFVVFEIVV